MNYNIVEKLNKIAEEFPNRLAIVMQQQKITFSELSDSVKRAAHGLRESGIKSGDAVVVMIPMSIDLYILMLAIIYSGAVCVFFDPWLPKNTISQIVALVKPRAYAGNWKSRVLRLANKDLRKIPIGIFSVKKLLQYSPDTAIFEADRNSPALITFSSGSSGTPKGADRTHGFLLAQHQALKESFATHPVSMNMFPIFALNNLGCGTTSIIPEMNFKKVRDIDAHKIAEQIKKYTVTSCTASPPFFDQLARCKDVSLSQIITGGGAVSDKQLKLWQKAFPGAEIIVAYGSTEAEPVAHISAQERLSAIPEKPGYCMGKPIPQIEAKVIQITKDPVESLTEVELALGEIGELIVAGDHVCRNYYRNPEATRLNKIIEGDKVWHRMGDTGYFDKNGFFCLVGRVHSTLKIGDQFVHPQQVEYIIKSNFEQVQKVAVVNVKAQLILVTDTPLAEAELKALLAKHHIPIDRVLSYEKEFPVDPRHNTKIDYAKLATLIEMRL